MGGKRIVSSGLAAAALTAAGLVAAAGSAHADQTVVVEGTAFPDPARANLSFVGCTDLYQRAAERLVPMVGTGPGAAPAGERSLGFDLAGGNAAGALLTVDSVLGTATASLDVHAVGRATGVVYAGYRAPSDAGTTLLWLGRSEVVTPGGAWQTVEATSRAYTWTKYDMATGRPVAEGPGVPMTVAAFAAAQGGDGPGLFTIGFGCDGTPFSVDRWRVGGPGAVTTYDVEGLTTRVTIAADSRRPVRAGDEVTLTGQLRTRTGTRLPHATMILEQRRAGSGRWEQVLVAPVGESGARAVVVPESRTAYRWRFVARPLAEGSTSWPLVIDVLPPLPADLPADGPSEEPTEDPAGTPAGTPGDAPGGTSSEPTGAPSDAPAGEPSGQPGDDESPSADQGGEPSGGQSGDQSGEPSGGPGAEQDAPSAPTATSGPDEAGPSADPTSSAGDGPAGDEPSAS